MRHLLLRLLVEEGEDGLRAGAETMASCLDARLVDIPDGRHDWFAAQPAAGAQAILAFLDQQPQ